MKIALNDISIRTTLKAGDLGYITYLHGSMYSSEYGYGISFEAYVGKTLAEFKAIMDELNLPKPRRLDEAVPANLSSGLRHDAGAAAAEPARGPDQPRPGEPGLEPSRLPLQGLCEVLPEDHAGGECHGGDGDQCGISTAIPRRG